MESDAEPARSGRPPVVKVVGPCKSGKSTLVAGLRAAGYDARACGQEHSEAPTMWQRIAPPDYLIFLDVTLAQQQARVKRSDWSEAVLLVQQRRLAHARQHADLILSTDEAPPEEVLARVVAFLEQQGFGRPPG